MRHPFPGLSYHRKRPTGPLTAIGPGLAIRITGAVDTEKLVIARQADAIFMEEIRKAGLYGEISQAFAGVLDTRAVGVMGDQRVYGYIVQLRAVQTTDFMTATVFEFSFAFLQRVSTRIVNEVQGVTRVSYDSEWSELITSPEANMKSVTSKPPATIELE